MIRSKWFLVGVGWMVTMAACAGEGRPASSGASGIEGWRLAPVGGMTAQLRRAQGALQVTFRKPGEERRFLALEGRAQGIPKGARALVVHYRLDLKEGKAPQLGILVFEQGGGAWYRTGSTTVLGEAASGRVPTVGLRPTAFSQDRSGALEWSRAERMWVGLLLDGPAEGTLTVSQVRFTDEPYRPDRPVRITGEGPGQWAIGKDPAVEATLTTPNGGPEGQPCMRLEFRFPGGRHMYLTPSVPVPTADLEGYGALSFRYRASLPDGVAGLLVTLQERNGGQWFTQPPASAEWTTIRIPFQQFEMASWGKDPDGRLDVDQVASLVIGTHGTAAGAGGTGVIEVCDVQFVP